jgi:hypothetical protein
VPVYVCRKCKHGHCLEEFLKAHELPVKEVGCQKVCDGPVGGVAVDGELRWYGRLDKAKPMVAFVAVARGGDDHVPKPLAKREDRKRRGRPPR